MMLLEETISHNKENSTKSWIQHCTPDLLGA